MIRACRRSSPTRVSRADTAGRLRARPHGLPATIRRVHNFGVEPDYALGIEEELLLVDPATLELANGASELVARATPSSGRITEELYDALIECSTPVVRSAPQGMATLAALRRELLGDGATLLGSGLHPTAPLGDVDHVDVPRYQEI